MIVKEIFSPDPPAPAAYFKHFNSQTLPTNLKIEIAVEIPALPKISNMSSVIFNTWEFSVEYNGAFLGNGVFGLNINTPDTLQLR